MYYPPFTTQQLSNATAQPTPSKIPQEAITDAWIEDIKCRALFTEPNLRSSGENQSDEDEIMADADANTPDKAETSQISVKIQTSHGRGVVFMPGWIRAWAVEVLLESKGDIDQPSIPECVVSCMQKLPIDIRRDVGANCLVVGGTASMIGFRTRLKNEVRVLLTGTSRNKAQLKDLSSLSGSFEVINDPIPTQYESQNETTNRRRSNKVNTKAPAWNPAHYAWLGGSLAG